MANPSHLLKPSTAPSLASTLLLLINGNLAPQTQKYVTMMMEMETMKLAAAPMHLTSQPDQQLLPLHFFLTNFVKNQATIIQIRVETVRNLYNVPCMVRLGRFTNFPVVLGQFLMNSFKPAFCQASTLQLAMLLSSVTTGKVHFK